MRTASEQQQWEIDCYGCTQEKMIIGFDNAMRFCNSTPTLAMSILSDVQELIERNQTERARQYINRVKWLITERMEGKPLPGLPMFLSKQGN